MGDFLVELGIALFGSAVEGFLTKSRVKIWTKTVLFFLVSGLLTAGCGFLTYSCYNDKDPMVFLVSIIVTVSFAAMLLAGGIHGHKKGWGISKTD